MAAIAVSIGRGAGAEQAAAARLHIGIQVDTGRRGEVVRACVAGGHADTFVDLGQDRIAKLTTRREADAYREWGGLLQGVIPQHAFPQDLDEGELGLGKAALRRLVESWAGREVLILEKLGAPIDRARKHELDIKLGKSTASIGELRDQGYAHPHAKKVKLTLADLTRGSRSLLGPSRGFCLAGYRRHGEVQGGGRQALGRDTLTHLDKAFALPLTHREANLNKIRSDLESIRQKMSRVPVTFVASSLLIVIDERDPANTQARLIDLAHPVSALDPNSRADYVKLNRRFDEGLSCLIEFVASAAGAA